MYKCKECGREFEKETSLFGHMSSHAKKYKDWNKKRSLVPNKNCKWCGEELSVGRDKRKKFCTKECAANFNSRNRTKKRKYCRNCGKDITYLGKGRATLCKECNPFIKDYEKLTIRDLEYKIGHPKDKYRSIRNHSRKLYWKNNKYICLKCGYTKQVDVHHIKSISDFEDDTPISEVNSLTNLIGLCKRCHWEMENE
jgi:5-methylcytosine-specific restriction endonuclease McrA